MSSNKKSFPFLISAGLLLIVLTLGLAFLLAEAKSRLPQAAQAAKLPVINDVADFALTNQLGTTVSLSAMRGHVSVVDIIFTRCPGPCARMTRQMKEIQEALAPASPTRLVSLTTDPDFDTPPVLTTYAERFGADSNRWMFLTGTKKQIGDLATGSLKLTAIENPPEKRESTDDLWIHSTIFVVVDKKARLRGTFQTGGEGVEWADSKKQILDAIKELEHER